MPLPAYPRAGPADFGAGLCAAFLQALPVTGVAVSAFPGRIPETSIWATDAISARIDELQFDLGEGPRWEAARTRQPVELPDVRQASHAAWPVFAKALQELDVAALFVFPLVLGTMDIGVIELYSTTPGALGRADHSTALQLADAAAWKLLRHLLTAHSVGEPSSRRDESPLSRREVHQATGMVLAQAGVSATDALLLIRARAYSQGRSVRDVAQEVVNRTMDFSPAPGDEGTAGVK